MVLRHRCIYLRFTYTDSIRNTLTPAILEPEATTEIMNRASAENTAAPGSDAAKFASMNTTVEASEIEIDPTTHLPFLKNVHFNDFNISDVLKNRLSAGGFKTPTPVQAKAIPPALEGAD